MTIQELLAFQLAIFTTQLSPQQDINEKASTSQEKQHAQSFLCPQFTMVGALL